MAELVVIVFVLGTLSGLWVSRMIGAARDMAGR